MVEKRVKKKIYHDYLHNIDTNTKWANLKINKKKKLKEIDK